MQLFGYLKQNLRGAVSRRIIESGHGLSKIYSMAIKGV